MEHLSSKHFEPASLPRNVEMIPPMIVCQTLEGAVDEFIVAVDRIRKNYPLLPVDRVTEIVLELRRLVGPHKV